MCRLAHFWVSRHTHMAHNMATPFVLCTVLDYSMIQDIQYRFPGFRVLQGTRDSGSLDWVLALVIEEETVMAGGMERAPQECYV